MKRAAVLLLAACTSPQEVAPPSAGNAELIAMLNDEEKAAMEAALEKARPQTDAVLGADGAVTLSGERYELLDPVRGADLGQALVARARLKPPEQRTLRIDVEKGTPSTATRRLMAVLDAVGLEDYRLDLGR